MYLSFRMIIIQRDFYFKSSIETVCRKINKNFHINN